MSPRTTFEKRTARRAEATYYLVVALVCAATTVIIYKGIA